MCENCGCGDPEIVPVEVRESLLAGNDARAQHNREHLARHGVLAINLMGSPGAGKTALLEATARALGGRLKIAAVSADLATDLDADRLARAGIPSRSITTGTACHLDARLVHEALHHLDLDDVDILFLENVGNLVCPSLWDLGQAANVVALSVTEGEDKPIKYPPMFARADLVVITKIDLLPHVPVSLGRLEENVARVMPAAATMPVSAQTGTGIEAWIGWLRAQRWQRGATHAHPHTPHGHTHDHEHTHEHAHEHDHEHDHLHAAAAVEP